MGISKDFGLAKKMNYEKTHVTAEIFWEFEFPKFLGNGHGQKFCV